MKKTKIEWCDMTHNPVTGCLHGCEYCYARSIAKRFEGVWDGESAVFAACAKAPQHTYIFLTKNPKRIPRIAKEFGGLIPASAKGSVWLGVSATNEKELKYASLVTPDFISIEPLLEYLSPDEWLIKTDGSAVTKSVIIGAETGNRKGKVIPPKEWIDSIVSACDETSTPVFMKDSLIPIVGEESMRRDLPWKGDPQ